MNLQAITLHRADLFLDNVGTIDQRQLMTREIKDIQIEHIISLKQHYEAIGSTLTHAQRVEYANNPTHLVIANSSLNMSKGAKDLSEFILRVSLQNKCKYIKDYTRIADANNITLDKSDMEVINQNTNCLR